MDHQPRTFKKAMQLYEQQIEREVTRWKRRVTRNPSIAGRLAKSAQTKMNNLIPEKVHAAITTTIKQMVRGVLFGAGYTVPDVVHDMPFEKREELVQRRIDIYKKTAAAEGGITGAGGLLLGLADFPILLSLKLKLLYDISALYGHSVKDFKERLFILHIFQVAFSSQQHRREIFKQIENWKEISAQIPDDINQFDWRTFQQEYRDHIDLAKMAQLVPVIGAPVGFVVNNRLLKKLGETAIFSYRMRLQKTGL